MSTNHETSTPTSTATVDGRRDELLANQRRLAEKLERTTDPAQVVVLESCLAELQEEIDQLA